jgi:hypothetical protein
VSDPFAPTLGERLGFNRRLIVLISIVVAILGAAAYFKLKVNSIPPTFERGTIIAFGTTSGYDGNHPIMRVLTENGEERTIGIAPRVLRTCDVGEQVLLQRRGTNLRVAPEACDLAENES